MNDPNAAPPPTDPDSGPEPQPGRSPHSKRYIAVRILAAALVIGAALTVEQLLRADEPSRNTFGAKVRTKEIDSALLERTMPIKVVVPKGAPANERSLVVFLHGRGEDEASYLIEPMFEALSDLRTRAPVIAFPDGADSSYWHDRESGDWGSYVLEEAVPELVERFDIDPDKVAIGGISMGGFGAFDIARLQPSSFCAVAGHSPVIWESSGETADGAFDDADDFDRNNIIEIADSTTNPYSDLRVWIDAGTEDPFLDGDAAFEEALRAGGVFPVVKRSPGGHDNDYWNDNWDEYLQWYAYSLGRCEDEARQEAKAAKREAEAERRDAGKAGQNGRDGGPTGNSPPSTSATSSAAG